MKEINRSGRVRLLGLQMACLDRKTAAAMSKDAVREGKTLVYGMLNAAKIVGMKKDKQLFDAVNSADLLLADGMSVVWASRILGKALPERVTGIDLMSDLLEIADEQKWRIFFLGAAQDILDEVISKVQRDYPGIVIAGSSHGYYDRNREEELVERIRNSSPHILLVGMGSPDKEIFLSRWSARTGANILHGVGGSFDVMAGKVMRAPGIIQNCGLEWLWRTAQEPGRLWKRYLITNTLFTLMVLEELISKDKKRRSDKNRQ